MERPSPQHHNFMNIATTHRFCAFALCLLTTPFARAQAVDLTRGFMPDPRQVPGTAGGPVSAQTVQSDCRGFIGQQPSYVLTTSTGFNFLRVFAEAPTDLTLMIRGVQHTWCADDVYGTNPGVDLRGLPPGRYDIYVGTYSANQVAPYQLSFSELQTTVPTGSAGTVAPNPVPGGNGSLGNLNPNARPSGRPLNIPVNPFRPVAAIARTNGQFNASNVGGEGGCRGWVQAAPSHVMNLRTPQPFLLVAVTSAADSTLIIRRPDGSVICNDDRFRLNPGIQGSFPAGMYQIWVGAYQQGEVRPYRITVSSNPNEHPPM
jgi:hypothetical protein